MATSAWIESAARSPKPAAGVDREWGDHLLVLARADADREAAERDRAAEAVRRLCGERDAAVVLAILGLAEAAEAPETRRCIRCGLYRPLRDFAVYGGGRSGRRSYCRGCK